MKWCHDIWGNSDLEAVFPGFENRSGHFLKLLG